MSRVEGGDEIYEDESEDEEAYEDELYDEGIVYHAGTGTRTFGAFLLLIGVAVAALGLWIAITWLSDRPGSSADKPGVQLFFAIVGLFFFAGLFIWQGVNGVNARLVISRLWVKYNNVGIRLKAPWEEVSGPRRVKPGMRETEGLVISDAALTPWQRFCVRTAPATGCLAAFTTGSSGRSGEFYRTIPLDIFEKGGDGDRLRRDIRRYARRPGGKRKRER